MSLDLVNKDLRLITGLADELGVHRRHRGRGPVVTAACEAGFGSRDMASLSRFSAFAHGS